MFADEIRRAAQAAPRTKLPELVALMWRAFAAGQITEPEVEQLAAEIEARRIVPAASPPERRRVGSRPRTDASMARRRRWAASGRLPPQLAARFTLAEQAVLSVVAAEAARAGACSFALDHLAALAGVARSTAKAALRRARDLGCLTIEERRVSAWRNDTNVVRIVARDWLAWMRLTRREAGTGGGVRSSAPTTTGVSPGQSQRIAGTVDGLSEERRRGPGGRPRESGGALGRPS